MRIKNCNNEKKQRIAEQVEPWWIELPYLPHNQMYHHHNCIHCRLVRCSITRQKEFSNWPTHQLTWK
jgi:hypothetical protein